MPVVDNKKKIAKAVDTVVRPLLRLLIHWGIGYKDVTEALKRAYLEEARASLIDNGKTVTASVLSVVAGIHRKDSAQFLKDIEANTVTYKSAPKTSSAFTVFTHWTTAPNYQDTNGTPKTLPYNAPKGAPSFTSLCMTVTRDVRPKTILNELTRLNLVEEYNDNYVALKKEAFIASNDLETSLNFFSHNLVSHLNASITNVIGDTPTYFERMASHDNLTADDINVLTSYIEDKGMELLKDVYQQAEIMATRNEKIKRHARIDQEPMEITSLNIDGEGQAIEKQIETYDFSLGMFVHHTNVVSDNMASDKTVIGNKSISSAKADDNNDENENRQ